MTTPLIGWIASSSAFDWVKSAGAPAFVVALCFWRALAVVISEAVGRIIEERSTMTDNSLDDALRLLTKKKKKGDAKSKQEASSAINSSSSSMNGTKKRQRSSSVSKKDVDPLKRLEAFRERMFDVKHDVHQQFNARSASAAHPEDAVLLAKWKPSKDGKSSKKRRAMVCGGEEDEGDVMPRITVKAASKSSKKEEKKEDKGAVKSNVVKIPGQITSSKLNPTAAQKGKHEHHQHSKQNQSAQGKVSVQQKQAPQAAHVSDSSPLKKSADPNAKKQRAAAPQPSSPVNAGASSPAVAAPMSVVTQDQLSLFDNVLSLEDPLEKAMESVHEQIQASEKTNGGAAVAAEDAGVKPKKHAKKRKAKKSKTQAAKEAAARSEDPASSVAPKSDETPVTVANGMDTAKPFEAESVAAQKVVPPLSELTSGNIGAQSADPQERKRMIKKQKRKRQQAMKAAKNASIILPEVSTTLDETLVVDATKVETEARAPLNQGNNGQPSGLIMDSDLEVADLPKKQPPVQRKRLKSSSDAKPADGVEKKKEPAVSSHPIASQRPTKRQKVGKVHAPKPVAATTTSVEMDSVVSSSQQIDLTDFEGNTESVEEEKREEEDDDASDGAGAMSRSQKQMFSDLIDEAARQQWELMEVGRLVRLFAGQWSHRKESTSRFLRRYCPELVNVDFLEGLNVQLGPEHLVKIFDRGSGNANVLMNKLASAVENGHLHVKDTAFLDVVGKKVRHMATNQEVLEFILPLLESLSSVRDVSHLLKHVCEHWHLDRTATLVQQILLTAVFDDLDGNQDEILKDLPQLKGKLDFPSRLDQEDADENGNLIGLIANEDSDLGEEDADSEYDDAEDALGEIHSDDEHLHEDEDDDDYEGETDSDEERAALAMSQQQRPKRRSRFILDEADEDDGEEEDELETEDDDDELESEDEARATNGASHLGSEDSESDSDDETWRSKPKRSSSKP